MRWPNYRQANQPGKRFQQPDPRHQQNIGIQFPVDVALAIFHMELLKRGLRVYTTFLQLLITAGDIHPLHRFAGPARE